MKLSEMIMDKEFMEWDWGRVGVVVIRIQRLAQNYWTLYGV